MDAIVAQYGALGLLVSLAVGAVGALFRREVSAHKDVAERADRLEAELKRLNDAVQSQYLTTLAQATVTIAEAVRVLSRGGGGGS